MPGYVPPHLRGKKANTATVTRRGVRFVGNATGNTNVVSSKGKRYTPRMVSPAGKKKTLKSVRKVTPNAKPVWEPSHALRKAAPKFAKAAMEHLGLQKWQEGHTGNKTKKRKGKKAKHLNKN